MALQASLNTDRKICNQLPCPFSMTYRTSFQAAFGAQSDMNADKKKKKKSCLRTDRENNFVLHLFSINSFSAAGYQLGYQNSSSPHGMVINGWSSECGKDTLMRHHPPQSMKPSMSNRLQMSARLPADRR